MNIYGGVTQTAIQEAALQKHLTSGEKKKKKLDDEDDAQHLPSSTLLEDEADVTESQKIAQQDEQAVKKAQTALNKLSPARTEKLDSVNERMSSGFYNEREVMEAVADKLLTMFRKDWGNA
ncbi:MAG: hypothetical protein QF473_00255 [Planctomycetota bacterium]|jgi:hypothetical protein|nr:hypothetical protein [Planctomycetota bacterium]